MKREEAYHVEIGGIKMAYLKDFKTYICNSENRKDIDERFYTTSRAYIEEPVNAIDRLINGEIDELFICMPPCRGKTALLKFLGAYIIGRGIKGTSGYICGSQISAKHFAMDCSKCSDESMGYTWNNMFQDTVCVLNAIERETGVVQAKRGTAFGSCQVKCKTIHDCDFLKLTFDGILMFDDLYFTLGENYEKASDKIFELVSSSIISRATTDCKVVWCQTRAAHDDIIGRRIAELKNNKMLSDRRWEFVNVPELGGVDKLMADV